MLTAMAVVVMAVMATGAVAGDGTKTSTDDALFLNQAVAVALSPVTLPASILGAPYHGWTLGWDYTAGIDNEIGRTAVRVAMSPLLLPAAILNIPSALLSPTGLTAGY